MLVALLHSGVHPTLFTATKSYSPDITWLLSNNVARWLGHDYWAAISNRLGFIALSRFGGVHLVGTHDEFWG